MRIGRKHYIHPLYIGCTLDGRFCRFKGHIVLFAVVRHSVAAAAERVHIVCARAVVVLGYNGKAKIVGTAAVRLGIIYDRHMAA